MHLLSFSELGVILARPFFSFIVYYVLLNFLCFIIIIIFCKLINFIFILLMLKEGEKKMLDNKKIGLFDKIIIFRTNERINFWQII